MLKTRSIAEEFLYRFTEEIIAVKKLEFMKKNIEKKEDVKIKRQIEIAKLREKFQNYGKIPEQHEIKKEIKPIIHIIPQQLIKQPPMPPKQPKEEMIPSINTTMQPAQIIQPKLETQKMPISNTLVPQRQTGKIITIPIPPQQPPLQDGEIDFGKIRFLIRDPLVTYIECMGIEKNLIIRRAGITTKIQITLTKEEILSIIKLFSETAKIPLIEGMLNARISNLEMSAVVSKSSACSFILKKNPIPDMNKPLSQLQKPMMQIPTMPGVLKPNTLMPPKNSPFNV